jgi:PPOX class probable FMN-dependent enzyme
MSRASIDAVARLGRVIDADSHAISSPDQLWELFGDPLPRAVTKEAPALDERAREFIAASPFLVMATTGADGSCDAGPKGGPPGFVHVVADTRLLVPEFPGNRRFDGVQNLVERPGIGLLFVVPGLSETLRVNGYARLTRDPELLDTCAVDGKAPWFVADVEVRQVFSHCGKAFLRGHLWKPESWPDPDEVRSPSRTIAGLAEEERRRESDVRREVEDSYRPGLYGEPKEAK